MFTQIWILLIVYQHPIYANKCPDIGEFCVSIYQNAPNGEQCSTVTTKEDCITLMRQYPCIWNPHNNLPNSNYIDLETMKFVEERIWMDRLEKVHKRYEIKPDLYRLDDCGLVYSLNVRDSSIFDQLDTSSYFSSSSIIDESNPTFYNDKTELIDNGDANKLYRAIGFLEIGHGKHCTATLISPQHIVTAASCFLTYSREVTNFNFLSSINDVKFYPALNTNEQDISHEYNTRISVVYIHSDFIANDAVCLYLFISIIPTYSLYALYV